MLIPLLQREISLSDFVGPQRETRLEAFLVDSKAVDPLQRIHEFQVRRLVARALLQLDERERHIIRSRFGLGGKRQTLNDIGRHFSLSRERIRQLEYVAKKKLKAAINRFDNPPTIHTTGKENHESTRNHDRARAAAGSPGGGLERSHGNRHGDQLQRWSVGPVRR